MAELLLCIYESAQYIGVATAVSFNGQLVKIHFLAVSQKAFTVSGLDTSWNHSLHEWH